MKKLELEKCPSAKSKKNRLLSQPTFLAGAEGLFLLARRSSVRTALPCQRARYSLPSYSRPSARSKEKIGCVCNRPFWQGQKDSFSSLDARRSGRLYRAKGHGIHCRPILVLLQEANKKIGCFRSRPFWQGQKDSFSSFDARRSGRLYRAKGHGIHCRPILVLLQEAKKKIGCFRSRPFWQGQKDSFSSFDARRSGRLYRAKGHGIHCRPILVLLQEANKKIGCFCNRPFWQGQKDSFSSLDARRSGRLYRAKGHGIHCRPILVLLQEANKKIGCFCNRPFWQGQKDSFSSLDARRSGRLYRAKGHGIHCRPILVLLQEANKKIGCFCNRPFWQGQKDSFSSLDARRSGRLYRAKGHGIHCRPILVLLQEANKKIGCFCNRPFWQAHTFGIRTFYRNGRMVIFL